LSDSRGAEDGSGEIPSSESDEEIDIGTGGTGGADIDIDIELLDRRCRRIWWATEFSGSRESEASTDEDGDDDEDEDEDEVGAPGWGRIEVMTGTAMLRLLRRHYTAAAAAGRWQSQRLLVAEVEPRVRTTTTQRI